ncbi:transcriptional regulator [Novosphingobium sediminis]|uniref:Transcriptional regulator n=1 Tax=Novosphingobium sediminis TaxID=707214 RepID=A0A512AG03_9SPHN|nr:AraC family transcriptional regulator [Novosphingobium sediminis]GEN98629.1 transcriptional regulator [Novosphingobium sediminis]
MAPATVRAAAMNGWESFLENTAAAPMLGDGPPPDSMPLAEFVRFSEDVVARTRDVAIPWLAGGNYDLAALGPLGDAINSAGRVGSALRRLVDFFSLLQDCTDIRLGLEDDMASVSYRILDPDIWPRHHDAMFTLGIVSQILKRGTRGHWDKIEFAFEAESHEMRGDIGKVVCAPCTFGADTNQIRFPAAMLDLALPQPANPPLADVRQLTRSIVSKRRATPLVDRLSQMVLRDLNSCAIEQERFAREMGMSSRTLRRKLTEQGSSFQQVLDECRMRQAVFEFRVRPDLSIAQIALRLGYAEHSNFTRAFHRWSGISPQAYRANLAATAH